MIDMKLHPVNQAVSKWKEKMEKESEPFGFIQIDFLVDMREAQKRYKEEYKNDTGKINTLQIPFLQWLDLKKYEAAKFHVKHNDYNLD
jgi:hypothetical protein